ncbi:MAG: PEP-CTERM sorting domain-containing protein [Lentisphaeria bacterium]|nr:PEP-CTERM sorting domain-containing protein [Lentisphaeria bacterium]
MKTRTVKTLSIGLFTGMALTASAANTLISGDLSVGTNWDTGAPTTIGNIGIIDADNTAPNNGIMTSTALIGLYIEQTGGLVSASGITQTLDTTQYEISGGNMNINGLVLTNAASLLISGGDVALGSSGNPRSITITAGSFTITSGTLAVSNDIAVSSAGTESDKVYNFDGGIVTVVDDMANSFQADGTFNFSGSTSVTVGGQFGADQAANRLVNIGLGTGSLTTGTLETRNMFIDWTSDSLFSLTATSIVQAGAASSWQNLWDAGRLTVDGIQDGTFEENFLIVGNTLTFNNIPEPSSFLIMGLAGLGVIRRRRR